MKELSQRPEYIRYISGELIPAHDFNNGALDVFANYVWSDVAKEHCTRQLDFEGEVWYRKTRPIKTAEQQKLSEVRELKNGTTRTI